MFELTTDNVQDTLAACIADDEPDRVIVEGVVNNYALSASRLRENEQKIRDLISQLDPTFHKTSGGGWTFLNLCMRADGVQWTGLHLMQERLYVMAAGLGLASMMPRALWSVLPGGVPYMQFDPDGEVVIKLEEEHAHDGLD